MLPKAMTDDRIAAVPKGVFFSKLFERQFNAQTPGNRRRIAGIFAAIKTGKPLPHFAYRKGIDDPSDVDHLLKAEGWMHLHYNEDDDDLLLWLKQFDKRVIFVAIDRHEPHFSYPVGKAINKKYGGVAERLNLDIEAKERKT